MCQNPNDTAEKKSVVMRGKKVHPNRKSQPCCCQKSKLSGSSESIMAEVRLSLGRLFHWRKVVQDDSLLELPVAVFANERVLVAAAVF